ncbi:MULTISPECIES: alpha-glucuronidase family glycosyl hydrolase [unclassified Sphingomonas]|uniref:alpha-glucuronidase family glycosyl hydrolase n=1 Tax=unclassified Sphingomonas TaxID=196159 RepID=UPI000E724EEB|nr:MULTISPECIES: alpha-glucuronidase family glycosyl hydrolase [unclassified Sphingomonas]RKE45750.1 alpha-glucuronidase [Sphingomonas sp. PP-CC-1A-547]TCM06700.1 alpha-glucuronidase [Sphingomonas sp. PP-CC-3G-468]
MTIFGRWIGKFVLLFGAVIGLTGPAQAEDGYDLWLRYPASATANPRSLPTIEARGDTPTLKAAAAELRRGVSLFGTSTPTILLTTTKDRDVAALRLPLAALGDEGYRVGYVTLGSRHVLLVTANTDRGVLYGSFALLRHLQTGGSVDRIDLTSTPRVKLRVLNHWDNLDGVVERGYAGASLWDWWTLPDFRDPRYTDYARANASIGINGTVLNNVNAKTESLTAPYIAKAAALADVFRPYGIKVYLSARFSAPIELGGLKTADPLDPQVAAWWKAKTDEIYRSIPDFGGFLVKANSEGQPGPRDYHRSHADGANMLAAAVAPHGGIVMWRAFVYAETDPDDRAKQAYTEFKPLDGKFAPNVIVQVKNGAIDFQPREPFHPLFGAMPKTPLMIEFQITKEYLGFATHLAYLGPLFAETLGSQTMRTPGETVAKVVDGSVEGHRLTGMAGVANIGRDRDWAGSTFNQANWYAFGRMAWDPTLGAAPVAREWAAMTFAPSPKIVDPVVAMMMGSREAVVDYMTPLGLAHVMATGHHYGPGPWVADLKRPEWNPVYYHRADKGGIGFDRTKTGSNAVAQYAPELSRKLAAPATTPERDLLWFHHVPWAYRTNSGRSVWAEMVHDYDAGVSYVAGMRRQWEGVKTEVDAERWVKTATYLAVQEREARWWRDASLAYWMSVNGLPLPAGAAAPAHDLAWYKAQRFPYAPGNPQ